MSNDIVNTANPSENQSSTLCLLVSSQFEVLATLQSHVRTVFACRAFQTQDDLLGGLCFLVENWLGLTTITLLFSIITTLSLGVQGSFSGLVLGDLVGAVCLKKGE